MAAVSTQAFKSILDHLKLSDSDLNPLKLATATLHAGRLRVQLTNSHFTIALTNPKLKYKGSAPSRGHNETYNGGSSDGLYDAGGGRVGVPKGLRDAAKGSDKGDEQRDNSGSSGDGNGGGGAGDDEKMEKADGAAMGSFIFDELHGLILPCDFWKYGIITVKAEIHLDAVSPTVQEIQEEREDVHCPCKEADFGVKTADDDWDFKAPQTTEDHSLQDPELEQVRFNAEEWF